jgi:trypsin
MPGRCDVRAGRAHKFIERPQLSHNEDTKRKGPPKKLSQTHQTLDTSIASLKALHIAKPLTAQQLCRDSHRIIIRPSAMSSHRLKTKLAASLPLVLSTLLVGIQFGVARGQRNGMLSSADRHVRHRIRSVAKRSNTTQLDEYAVHEDIVGGTAASASSYNFYGISKSGPLCGATLIHVDIAVTAAHCGGVFRGVGLYLGGSKLNGQDAVEVVGVLAEYPHPNFNAKTLQHDIMLLKLNRGSGSSTNSKVQPIAGGINILQSVPALGTPVTVIGMGASREDGSLSSVLNQVDVVVQNGTQKCVPPYNTASRSIHYLEPTMICASDTNKDACQGDSGGPLLQKLPDDNFLMVGLVSWGVGYVAWWLRTVTVLMDAQILSDLQPHHMLEFYCQVCSIGISWCLYSSQFLHELYTEWDMYAIEFQTVVLLSNTTADATNPSRYATQTVSRRRVESDDAVSQ